MNDLDWMAVSKLPWRQRNAHVERAVRTYLADKRYRGVNMGSIELAYALLGYDTAHDGRPLPSSLEGKNAAKLATLLTKMAPYMGPLATHDGEAIRHFGKLGRRWRWHGQR